MSFGAVFVAKKSGFFGIFWVSAMLIAIMFLVIAISMKVSKLCKFWVWVDRDQHWS